MAEIHVRFSVLGDFTPLCYSSAPQAEGPRLLLLSGCEAIDHVAERAADGLRG